MKGLMALVLAVGLVLGVGNAYALAANDVLVHRWVSGGDYTEPSLIPTDLAAGVNGPVLYTEHLIPGSYQANIQGLTGEEAISMDNGFVLEKMVADALGISVADVAKRLPEKSGIVAIYEELGFFDYPGRLIFWGE